MLIKAGGNPQALVISESLADPKWVAHTCIQNISQKGEEYFKCMKSSNWEG